MLRRTFVVLATALSLQACDKNGPIVIVPESTESYDFESSLEGWEQTAGNLEAPGALYVLTTSQVASSTGSRSAELRIDNFNSNARLWMQRVATLSPGVTYDVTMTLDLGSRDGEATTPWRLIAAALPGTSISAASMGEQGDTNPDSPSTGGVNFSTRSFTIRVQSDPESGEIALGLGIWGRTTGERAYYIDNLKIEFLRAN